MSTADNESVAAALGRIPSGLFVVTIRKDDDATAFLASWIQQASFEPLMLSVGVKKGRPAQALLDRGAAFAVNVIGDGDTALIKPFARGFSPGDDPYQDVDVELGTTGVECLSRALAVLECRPVRFVEAGDHVLYVGEVVAGRMREGGGAPAVHVRKSGLLY